MIISQTPFRISFFGGGTDYPVWYREYGGAVLSTSIDKYCYITCRYLPPFFEYHSRVLYSKVETVRSNEEIEHPAVRGILRYLDIGEGVEIHHDGDLPARTGLGSSSSFTVGLLHGLLALRQMMPTKMQLAKQAIHIEQDLLKENVGSQDQISAAFGGLNRIDFKSEQQILVTPMILNPRRLDEFHRHLLLFFTGFSRIASEIAAEQINRSKDKKAELLRMREMVDEGAAILTGQSDVADFGSLLHESWSLKRGLSSRISTPQLDEIYGAARRAGAIGGKLLGAGGGGFMLFFARPEDHHKIRESLSKLLWVPFQFENRGSHIILYQPDYYVDGRFSGAQDLAPPSLQSRLGKSAVYGEVKG